MFWLPTSSQFAKPPDGAYGSLEKAGWSGMVGMLVRREAEVAVSAYAMTKGLRRYVDFASPMGTTK
jgi:hypothetical protein